MTDGIAALSFLEQFKESFGNSPEGVYSGHDTNGRYGSRASLLRANDLEHILETRTYLYPSGRIRRVARVLTDAYGTNPVRIEEWNEDGSRHYITSYAGAGEWVWEKAIDHRTGAERLWVNRDSFIFILVTEDTVRALENGAFDPQDLYDMKWEDVREAVLELLGAARVVPALPFTVIDSLGTNRLLKLDWRIRRPSTRAASWCFLELHCTTTGKVSYLRVPPNFTDIMSAIAWTFGMDKENYKLEEET